MTFRQRIKRLFERSATPFGFDLHLLRRRGTDYIVADRSQLMSYTPKNELRRLYDVALERTGLVETDNFWKQCRFYGMAQVLASVVGLATEGDVAECGCWKGTSSYMISSILADAGFDGRFHIFDSFEGSLSEFGRKDINPHRPLSESDVAGQKATFVSTEAEVKKALDPFPFVETHGGWIPTRFSDVADRRFFFVHIDVDLYQPTLDSLAFFYSRLVDGGAVVFDDYGVSVFPGAKLAIDEYLAAHPPKFFYESPTGGAFLIK